ncbi:MAG: phasin family protein [Burkholderiales bacterium]|nr:phasin family protein [Burkholderiales bacterium]
MAKRQTQKAAEKAAADNKLLDTIRASAQEIWQAGLGAFAKAQSEGTKLFEALVKEGEGLSKKTRGLAEAKIGEVTGNVTKAATKAQASANEAWDKLEQVFQDRVARAINRLGVPTQRDVQSLAKRVEELTASVQALGGKPARAAAAARKAPARKAPARKAAAKGSR